MYQIDVKEVIRQIHRDLHPQPSRWYCIGRRNGKRVYMTESALRRANIHDICSDPLLKPLRRQRYPNRKPHRPAHESNHPLVVFFIDLFFKVIFGSWPMD